MLVTVFPNALRINWDRPPSVDPIVVGMTSFNIHGAPLEIVKMSLTHNTVKTFNYLNTDGSFTMAESN